jgi:hypothetical protein
VKLRIKGDSLRLRLTRGEVDRLASHGSVEEQVHFSAEATFAYRLTRVSARAPLGARFAHGVIEIDVSEQAAERWCTSDLVSLDHTQQRGGSRLRILVEKDWACLAPREDEDESDNFRHPKDRSAAK